MQVGILDAIGQGEYDQEIKHLAEFLVSFSPRRMFIRVGYECDGNHNHHDPTSYKVAPFPGINFLSHISSSPFSPFVSTNFQKQVAFRRVVSFLRQWAPNAEIVWHSWARPQSENFLGLPASAWWPGDKFVDWIGISLFDQVYHGDGFV